MEKRIYKSWSKIDEEFMINNYENYSIKDFSLKLNRCESSIKCKLRKLKLSAKKSNSFNWYSDEDIDFLKSNYNKISVISIGKILGKSTASVRFKLRKLGLNGNE